MRVLVGCERSGIVRDAFIAKGHEAISCDIEDTQAPGPHYKGSVLDIMNDGFDLAIFHPPCTYLTNAANKWLYVDSSLTTVAERLELREEAIEFFLKLGNADIPRIAIENPQPHPYVISKVGRFQDKIQPWMFGDPETKGICWWLKGLPPLFSTQIESKREALKHSLPPGPERAMLRSKFFPGVSAAMADQWSNQ